MKQSIFLFGTLLCLLTVVKCSKDKAPDPNVVTAQCDSTTTKYSVKVKPILDANCATSGCHDAATQQSGYDYSSYTTAKTGADRALCKMDGSCGSVMPPTGQLADSLIQVIKDWKNQGFCQ
jgi:hypothetical protein